MTAPVFARLAAVLIVLLASKANAGDIYRWVDEKGQTHVADKVPPQYQKRATKVDTSASKVSESERDEASARLARQKSAIPEPTVSAPTGRVGSLELAPQNKPGASGIDEKRLQCEQWRIEYEKSMACFGRFGIRGGGMRGEAHRYCTEVRSPSPECGIPS